jgi:AcrR family transcriptional regulator
MERKEQDQEPLPAAVSALWQRRDVPRRGPRPNLTLDRIINAGIELADADGLTSVSMARIGERVGHTAMSLYRYVRNKDELLQLMIDVAAANEPPPEAAPREDWRTNLERWAKALAALYRRHPWVLQVPIGRTTPVGPGQLAWLDRGLACLADTPMQPDLQVAVVLFLLIHVRGEIRFALDVTADESGDEPQWSYGEVLRQVVDPARLPALGALVAAGAFDDTTGAITDAELDAQLEFGLGRVLDGIEALVGWSGSEGSASTAPDDIIEEPLHSGRDQT